MKTYLNPHTQKIIDTAVKRGSHAIILSGPVGIGLATIAANIARQTKQVYYAVLPEKDEKIDLEKGTITIQSIRKLYDLTKTREPNGRLIVIDYAERMGIPAQNAFLKLLEEPVEGTTFLLLTHVVSNFLPTIISRSQHIEVLPIEASQTEALLDDLKVHDPTKRAQLTFIASGKPAELTRLATNDEYFQNRAQIVKDAREFITGSPYTRLKLAALYKSDRTKALTLLDDAARMVQKSLAEGADPQRIKILERIEQLHKRVSEQGNIRLQLSTAAIL